MNNLHGYSFEEILEICEKYNQKKFRATQLFEALISYKSAAEITNLPKDFLCELEKAYNFNPVKIKEKYVAKDGTIKFIFELCDGCVVEGVLMSYSYGNTICISTQVGCAMGCKFCASTKGGLIRNLSAGEMCGFIYAVNKFLGGSNKTRKITNIVLMGSGEPLLNFDNVVKFVKNISSQNGIQISQRNISLSTCGIVPNIKKLAQEKLQITLAISLHSPYDEERKQIMPIANTYKIADIVAAAKEYFFATKRRIIFEYALIQGENDSKEHAFALCKLLKNFSFHINLIPLNSGEGYSLKGSSKKTVYEFLNLLEKNNVSASVRRTMGDDVGGACGQLKAKLGYE